MQVLTHRSAGGSLSHNPYLLAALVIFIIPISGLATDIFVPSLPSIQAFFGSSQALVQATIISYLIGLGVMQLFAGGISDSFGRRKPFTISTILFLAVTLCIPFSHSLYELIFFRFIQGLAVANMVVPMRAVMSDLFEGKTLQKMVTYMAFSWTIGPIIAPFIGGYLQHYFGWQAPFYFLLGYAALSSLLIFCFMPETSKYQHQFNLRNLFNTYKSLLINKNFLRAILTDGLLYALVITFMAVVPFLAKAELHYTPVQYGHLALLTGIAWSIGSLGNRFLLHLSITTRRNLALSIMSLAATAFVLAAIFMPLSTATLLIPTFITYIAGGTLMTTYFAYAMSLFPKKAASANALMGSFVFLVPALISSGSALLKSTTALPLAIAFAVLICAINAVQMIKDRSKL